MSTRPGDPGLDPQGSAGVNMPSTSTRPLDPMGAVRDVITAARDAIELLDAETPRLARWAVRLRDCLRRGGLVVTAGNGGSAAHAAHLAGELVGRFRAERPPLRAVCLSSDGPTLTALGNDYGYDEVFARQVRALVRPGDVVVLFSTSGRSPNIVEAASAARQLGATLSPSPGQVGTLSPRSPMMRSAPMAAEPRRAGRSPSGPARAVRRARRGVGGRALTSIAVVGDALVDVDVVGRVDRSDPKDASSSRRTTSGAVPAAPPWRPRSRPPTAPTSRSSRRSATTRPPTGWPQHAQRWHRRGRSRPRGPTPQKWRLRSTEGTLLHVDRDCGAQPPSVSARPPCGACCAPPTGCSWPTMDAVWPLRRAASSTRSSSGPQWCGSPSARACAIAGADLSRGTKARPGLSSGDRAARQALAGERARALVDCRGRDMRRRWRRAGRARASGRGHPVHAGRGWHLRCR